MTLIKAVLWTILTAVMLFIVVFMLPAILF